MNKILKSLMREKHHSLLAILLALFIIIDVKINPTSSIHP